MKKASVLMLVFCFCAVNVFAHPPREMEIEYAQDAKVLSLKMIHVVTNPNDHFIRKVEIQRSNGEVQKKIYYRQKYLKDVEILFPVTLNPGETIQVKAFCKKGGVLTESFTVPVPKKAAENTPKNK